MKLKLDKVSWVLHTGSLCQSVIHILAPWGERVPRRVVTLDPGTNVLEQPSARDHQTTGERREPISLRHQAFPSQSWKTPFPMLKGWGAGLM